MTEIGSSEETRLIRAVCDDPDSDAPRLAYATWLKAQGRNDRARIIEVQCGIEALRAEEKALLDRNAREWGKPLSGMGVDHWAFHRGFPEEIHIDARHFFSVIDGADTADSINTVTPVRHLTLGGVPDDLVGRLATMPVCRQLLSLDVGDPHGHHQSWEFGTEGLRTLAHSPELARLKHLTLHSDKIGAAGAKLIADSPVLGNLTHLHLDDSVFNRKGHNSIRALAVAPALANLEYLRMGNDEMKAHTLKAMREQFQAGLIGKSGR